MRHKLELSISIKVWDKHFMTFSESVVHPKSAKKRFAFID